MVKKRGLGKSLDALFAFTSTDSQHPVEVAVHPIQEQLMQLAVEHIQRGKYQPRREMDSKP